MHPVSSPANRTEWNRKGMLIVGGDGYNITENFFDREGTCGLAFLAASRISITAKVCGAVEQSTSDDNHTIRDPPRRFPR